MVVCGWCSPGPCLFRAPICRPLGGDGTREAGGTVCHGERGSALSSGYVPDSVRVEGSSIVDEPGEC